MGFSPWNASVMSYPKQSVKGERKGSRGCGFLRKMGGSLCCALYALLTPHLFPTLYYKRPNYYQTDRPTH